jgi:hypothetical protein
MFYTYEENSSAEASSSATSSFMNAIDSNYNEQNGTGMVLGENGAPAYSMHNMAGITNTELQGALVAAFNGMLRNTPETRVYQLMDNVLQTAKSARGSFESSAVADLFVTWAHCRDRNDGKGERAVSYHMFMWLYEHFPRTTYDLLSQYPTLGYWKDLSQLYLLVHQTKSGPKWNTFKNNIVLCFTNQLNADAEELNRNPRSTDVSLCAKYVPKEGRSFDKKTKITKAIAAQLFPELFKTDFRKSMKKFRTLYTRLNRHIDTVEIKECSGRWSEIDFNRVPGRALNIQRKAFLNTTKSGGEELRHPDNVDRMKCRENFQSHLQKAVRGEVKVKGKTMFIHELVEQIMNGLLNTPEERVLIESQWNAHVDHFRQTMEETNSSLGKGLCLVDVSGSMGGIPLNVAIAMGIFASSFAHPAFRDRFISFESMPRWIVLRYPSSYTEYQNKQEFSSSTIGEWDASRAGGELSLYEKVMVAMYSPWGGATDFVAAHELILEACVKANLRPEDLPEWFMILSDMQFNEANKYCNNNYGFINQTLGVSHKTEYKTDSYGYGYGFKAPNVNWTPIHEMLGRAYHSAGMKACGRPYDVPQQIYWNLRGNTVGFPVQSDTPNTQLISGFSVALLKLFLTENDVSSYVAPVRVTPTPWDTFRKAIDSDNYYMIRQVCTKSTEGCLQRYEFVESVNEEIEDIE